MSAVVVRCDVPTGCDPVTDIAPRNILLPDDCPGIPELDVASPGLHSVDSPCSIVNPPEDFTVGGITPFLEHHRGLCHHRLDCIARLHCGLPLRRRDATLMTTEEAAECRSTFGGVKVPYVETCPNLSVLKFLKWK